MRIDVHTHIFAPEIVRDRHHYFDGEPVFKALYDSPRARLATAESLVEAMARNAIDRAVVFGFPWHQAELAARHNDYVLEAAARHAPTLIPFACVHPLMPASGREAERCLAQGAAGLGELAIYEPSTATLALPCFDELVGCCRSHGAVMLVHANEPVGHPYPGKSPMGLAFYYALAALAGDLTLILAHWGGGLGFFQLLKKETSEVLRNVYYDTAASPFLYKPAIYAHMAAIVGEERILFGSDFPLISPDRYFKEMTEAGLTSKQIEAIAGGNAARLLRI